MTILTSADYPAVRRLVDTQLSAIDLPDAVISEIVYHDAAEAWIVNRDPDAATRTGAEASAVKRATLYWLASLLVPAAYKLTSVSVRTTDVSYTRPGFNSEKRIKELRQWAERELDSIPGVAVDLNYVIRKPVIFNSL